MARITELVIPRASWAKFTLRHHDGSMCCLGHLSVACGVPPSELEPYNFPPQEWVDKYSLPEWAAIDGNLRDTAVGDTTVGNTASLINDTDIRQTSANREAQLIELFARNGIKLTFEGEYGPFDELNQHLHVEVPSRG